MAGGSHPTGQIGLAVAVKVPDAHIDPRDRGAPSGPATELERGTIGEADPHISAFSRAGDDVGLAVAVEIPHEHVRPSHPRGHAGPQTVAEACGAIGNRTPHLAVGRYSSEQGRSQRSTIDGDCRLTSQ